MKLETETSIDQDYKSSLQTDTKTNFRYQWRQ